jgi:hypothetical protein
VYNTGSTVQYRVQLFEYNTIAVNLYASVFEAIYRLHNSEAVTLDVTDLDVAALALNMWSVRNTKHI